MVKNCECKKKYINLQFIMYYGKWGIAGIATQFVMYWNN